MKLRARGTHRLRSRQAAMGSGESSSPHAAAPRPRSGPAGDHNILRRNMRIAEGALSSLPNNSCIHQNEWAHCAFCAFSRRFARFFHLRKEGIRKDWPRRGVRPFDCAPLDRARGRPFGLAQGKQGKRGGGCWPIRRIPPLTRRRAGVGHTAVRSRAVLRNPV